MVKIISPDKITHTVSEAEIQEEFERNLSSLEDGLVFVEHEFERGSGRIDTLAVDEDGSPVFIEYKKEGEFDEDALIQILDYLGWFLKDESRSQNLVNYIKKKVPSSGVDDEKPIRLILVVNRMGERVRNACYSVRNPIKIFTYNLIKFDTDISLVTRLELDNEKVELGLRDREPLSESQILERRSNLKNIYNKVREYVMAFQGVSLHTTGSGDVAFKAKKNFLYATFQKKNDLLAIKVGSERVKELYQAGKIEGDPSSSDDDRFYVVWLEPDQDLDEDLKHEIKHAIEMAK
jgi:hypothetical protein